MLYIAICDHDEPYRKALVGVIRTYLSTHRELHAQVRGIASSEEALTDPASYGIFLISSQWEEKGLETARQIRQKAPYAVLIFYTNRQEGDAALQAYRLDALQYLVKPLTEKMVFETMDKAVGQCGISPGKRIAFNSSKGLINLRITDILYAKSQGHRITLFLWDGEALESKCLRISFGVLIDPLLQNGFIRCHDSYVVNTAYAEQLTPEGILLAEGTVIPVSAKKRVWVRDILHQIEKG